MSVKWTPGPWKACDDGRCTCTTVAAADHPVAKVTLGEWGDEYPSLRLEGSSTERRAVPYMERIAYGEVSDDEAKANARLIAAAPEMADILKYLVSCIEDCEPCKSSGRDPRSKQDACRECGGTGEVLRASAFESASDARALLARIEGDE